MSREMIPSGRARRRSMEVMAAGGILGALAGVGAAYLLLQAHERRRHATGEEAPILTVNSTVKLGLLVFGLLRQVGDMAHGEK